MQVEKSIEESFQKLNDLAQETNSLYGEWGADDVSKMPLERKNAWAKLLSSIVSSESTEEELIRPLAQFFKKEKSVHDYIVQHALDEEIHANVFDKYVKSTFLYTKKRKSMTDKVIYDRLFKKVSHFSKSRPVPLLVAILFYEMCSDYFYKNLMKVAQKDGLENLEQIVSQIDRDENRHRAGIKFVFNYYTENFRPVDKVDVVATYLLLRVIWLDVNTSSYAFYNKDVIEHFKTLGLKPDEFHEFVSKNFRKLMTGVTRGAL